MSMSSCRSFLLPGAALSAMRLRRISMVRIVAGEEFLLLLLLQKSAKASWISLSSSAEMSFSLASLDRRLEVEVEAEAEAAAGALRLGGCVIAVRISDDYYVCFRAIGMLLTYHDVWLGIDTIRYQNVVRTE